MGKVIEITNNGESEIKYTEDVFGSMGFSSEESIALNLKSDLYVEILDMVRGKKLKQHDVSKILDIPQPLVSELLNGKIDLVPIEKLAGYAEAIRYALKEFD